MRPGRLRRSRAREEAARGILSPFDRRRPGVRTGLALSRLVLVPLAVAAFAGPIFWMLKGSASTTQELLRSPLRLWPAHTHFDNLSKAWTELEIGHYLWNTVVLVGGTWFFQIVVCTTGAYALSVLKPRYGKWVYGAVLATMFIPGVVSMVPLYLTVLDIPLLHVNLADTPWAVWLPAAHSAFNTLLMKRFFDALPAELYEAAEVDGAGPWTVFVRIVLPLSRPIIAVTSLFVVMGSWKEFLWPMIVLPTPSKQPLAAALPRLAASTDQSLLIAGLFIASIPPLIVFLLFQRHITKGIGFTGLKG